MEYTKEQKVQYAAEKTWKGFYALLNVAEKQRRLKFLKENGKDDINTLAKIKALEELIK